MKIDQLLEKNQQIQLSIFQHLVVSGGTMEGTQLAKKVGISKASLDQYMEELALLKDGSLTACSITKKKATYTIYLSEVATLERLTALLVKDSFKFQLLEHVLNHREFTITQLTQLFVTSESSIFRKIRELNELLAEFDIRVKNGRLQGDELQIRYFYFELYMYFPVEMRPVFLKDSDQNTFFFQALERTLATRFSEQSRQKVACWLGISRKRMPARKKQQTVLKKRHQLFKEDALFKQIEPLIRLYNSRNSFELNQYEPIMFYAFLVSFSVLETELFYQYELQRSKKLIPAVMDVYIREIILIDYRPRRLSIQQEKEIGYELAQINNQIYFFQGAIPFYDLDRMLQKQKENLGSERTRLLPKLQEAAYGFLHPTKRQDTLIHQVLLTSYASILSMIDFYIAEELSVGIDLEELPIYRVTYYQYLFSELRPIPGIQVEEVKQNEAYDLVLCTKLSARPNTATHYYCLSEFASSYDLIQVKELIERIKKEKN